MSSSLFQLPDELILTALNTAFPCREPQTRALATLLYPGAAPCRNLVIYGTEATGKSAITAALLAKLSHQTDDDDDELTLKYAVVNSAECITARHLYETVVAKAADALRWDAAPSRCETVSQLTVELSKMLKYTPRPEGFRFVLVFDAIDRQRDAPHTLLPALARLSEIIPSLTTVFIVTSPPPNFLLTSSVPHLHFPTYTKPDFIAILSASPPPALPNTTAQETADLWARFTAAVHDALARAASRTLPSFRHACAALWPRFTAPVHAGTHSAREFSKLLVAARVHFQDERLLDPGVLALATTSSTTMKPLPGTTTTTTTTTKNTPLPPPSVVGSGAGTGAGAALASLLPTTPRLLLLASYLASHNPTRHDQTLFSTHHHGRRRRRGGLSVAGMGRGRGYQRSKHRKIARKLLGAHAFVLERMLAILAAVRGEWEVNSKGGNKDEGGDGDVGMAIATLASLRLLVRVGGTTGGGDMMDCGGKWRVNVGWEVIRGLGRGVGVEVEEWLIE
ncbi:origin recognition complex subunit 5 C-terminus-domain-containing protein [Parachaetomium inaequale]|uniref:Origin recognition complex subunit 5 C-terminus-domain-containing protein n=1 Tax=Parachaetomium inaequale TaxID=2588326 RepID=A0AAN6PRH0_9PEZI|nr:origin recognition complex subunit 5 C-terminus-domain-containing protein [Parachaetomium inaequale]